MRAWGVVVVAALLFAPSVARAVDYAPVDQPGPALSVPEKDLAAALKCTDDVNAGASREPVLMVPGTTVSPEADFAWNWLRALSALHIPYCTVRSPGDTMADIQDNAEYIVYALREMHRRTGRKIEVIGHSQGGMAPRFSLRFWPDTRALVDDMVGLAPSNHGTVDAGPICAVNGCAPAIWQQRDTSPFIAAVNSRQETFKGIDYTVAYSHFDEVVVPNSDPDTASSPLRTGDGARSNIALQDLCPGDTSEHLATGTYDAVAYAIAMDAITHPGPADPKRIDPAVCNQPFQPGVNPATFATDYAQAGAYLTRVLATYPHVSAEPPLRCYVTASCPAAPAPAAPVTISHRCASRRVFTIHLRGRLTRARVTVDGRRVRIRHRAGRLIARIDLRGKPRGRATVRVRAVTVTGRVVREIRRYHPCSA